MHPDGGKVRFFLYPREVNEDLGISEAMAEGLSRKVQVSRDTLVGGSQS